MKERHLSPKLQEALILPSWELHYTLTEAIVRKAKKNVRWYHYPDITDIFFDPVLNKTLRNNSGYISVITTQEWFLVAELPLRVEWYYVGMDNSEDYCLAFYPRLVSYDDKNVHTDKHGYFWAFESVLNEILEPPYLFRPKGEKIVRVDRKKSPYKFQVESEQISKKSKKVKHPLLRNED